MHSVYFPIFLLISINILTIHCRSDPEHFSSPYQIVKSLRDVGQDAEDNNIPDSMLDHLKDVLENFEDNIPSSGLNHLKNELENVDGDRIPNSILDRLKDVLESVEVKNISKSMSNHLKDVLENIEDDNIPTSALINRIPNTIVDPGISNTIKKIRERSLLLLEDHESEEPAYKYQAKANNKNDFFINSENIKAEFAEISGYFLPSPSDYEGYTPIITTQCQEDVDKMHKVLAKLDKFTEKDKWALDMFDSWGKHYNAVLYGNWNVMGFFEQCLNTSKTFSFPEHTITGKVCVIDTGAFAPTAYIAPKYTTCVPDSCTTKDIKKSVRRSLVEYGYYVEDIYCYDRQTEPEWDTWVTVSVVVICVMTLPVILATFADIAFDEKPVWVGIFSAYTNLGKIMTVKMNNPGEISCLHAIRVISMCWVLLSHNYAFILGYVTNIMEITEISAKWYAQIVWAGYRSVDTFFLVGGMLVSRALLKRNFCIRPKRPQPTSTIPLHAYNTEETSEKIEDVPETKNSLDHLLTMEELRSQDFLATCGTFLQTYSLYVINRIVRLVPAIFLVTMFCCGVAILFIDGPNTIPYIRDLKSRCRQNWWFDITLFTNIIYSHYANECIDEGVCRESGWDSCLGQCWYIGVDYELFLFAPFIILPIKLMKRNIQVLYLLLVILVLCVIPGALVVDKGYQATTFMTSDQIAGFLHFLHVYIQPYTRASPYFVGALLALLLHFAEEDKKVGREAFWMKMLKKKSVRAVGWILCIALGLTCVFYLVSINNYGVIPDDQYLGGFMDFMIGAFQYAMWSLVVSWVILVCALGLAGPVNQFLSHPMWHPLSRVTFSVFLIHPPIFYLTMSSVYRWVYATHELLVLTACGLFTISFLSAFVISLIAEAPYINLLKHFIKK